MSINQRLDATAERLAKAANDNFIGQDGVRRLTDWPLARLKTRGLLDRDENTNRVLAEAGERYYTDWYYAGLSGIGAIDYSRERVDGGGTDDGTRRARAMSSYRAARTKLGKMAIVVDPVCLAGQTPTTAGMIATGRGKSVGQEHGMRQLLTGLRVLGEHYGMLRPETARAA